MKTWFRDTDEKEHDKDLQIVLSKYQIAWSVVDETVYV